MRSLANRICRRPDESSLRPEISDLLQTLESSMKDMTEKDDGEAEELTDEDFDGIVAKKQVRHDQGVLGNLSFKY